ncbi:flagellar biosynthesis protein FlhF [Heliobacterium chlorum]|uniref:Flagellar biosynthesis protein FlhF n=1 Tax=Heliobacterium chlorum TaxID=2698 RepID=A0ABR7SY23_HELCL|nr:flagellar biosynthesis protein FlhF [Heliobacterium chlorum]MBC9783433.1 flagellar biosynthesis protein FlhF [Heliobacterium chlorum]
MRVKRFVASTVQEAMNKMKAEMGKDAIILHTRKIKEGGFFGFFAREMVEITGAVEDTLVLPKDQGKEKSISLPKTKKVDPAPSSGEKFDIRLDQPVSIDKQLFGNGNANLQEPPRIAENVPPPVSEKPLTSTVSTHVSSPTNSGIGEELNQMKTLMGQILGRLQEVDANLPYELIVAYKRLIDNDVDESVARKIVEDVYDEHKGRTDWNPAVVKDLVLLEIQEMVGTPQSVMISDDNQGPEVFLMVGPTGVGKTTTIAKLAATFSIVNRRKVGLITADTYRIAAVEQLKTFGDIIGVPVEVVFTPPALREAIERNRDKDLLLVDTAGRSYKNELQLEELSAFVEASQPSRIILVLSATTKYKDLIRIVDSFSKFEINRFLLTKLDETNQYGSILNVIYATGTPLSYITTGQNVPDDIEIANPEKLANLIYGETSL